MNEHFQGNIKRIQWNNRLKSIGLSFYFIIGIFIFVTLFMAAIFSPVLVTGGIEGLVKIFSSKYATDPNYTIFKLLKPYIKVALFIMASTLYFFHKTLSNIGSFFDAIELNLNSKDQFYRILENMCISRGLKIPNLYISNNNMVMPNNLITGVITTDLKGVNSLIITQAVYELPKGLQEAYIAQAVSRIHSKDTMFLSLFCFFAYFPYHLEQSMHKYVAILFKPFLIATDFIIKPVREMIIEQRFAKLDLGSIELTKEKNPTIELLDRMATYEEMTVYIHDPYLSLFICKRADEYRLDKIKKA